MPNPICMFFFNFQEEDQNVQNETSQSDPKEDNTTDVRSVVPHGDSLPESPLSEIPSSSSSLSHLANDTRSVVIQDDSKEELQRSSSAEVASFSSSLTHLAHDPNITSTVSSESCIEAELKGNKQSPSSSDSFTKMILEHTLVVDQVGDPDPQKLLNVESDDFDTDVEKDQENKISQEIDNRNNLPQDKKSDKVLGAAVEDDKLGKSTVLSDSCKKSECQQSKTDYKEADSKEGSFSVPELSNEKVHENLMLLYKNLVAENTEGSIAKSKSDNFPRSNEKIIYSDPFGSTILDDSSNVGQTNSTEITKVGDETLNKPEDMDICSDSHEVDTSQKKQITDVSKSLINPNESFLNCERIIDTTVTDNRSDQRQSYQENLPTFRADSNHNFKETIDSNNSFHKEKEPYIETSMHIEQKHKLQSSVCGNQLYNPQQQQNYQQHYQQQNQHQHLVWKVLDRKKNFDLENLLELKAPF